MAVSKVVYKSSAHATPVVWMDATPATAAAADIISPKTAMLANGVVTTGTGSAGTVSAPRKDVNFYDYDGTIVASYTTAEFANITAFPANPSHTGLTAQGWNMPSNWTLSNAKTYIASYEKADWGQMYTTSSGKTEIDIELSDASRLSPYMSLAVNGTVSIDWGDSSTADTVTGSSLTTRLSKKHVYSQPGSYTIKVTASSGSWALYGTSTYFLLYKGDSANENRVYANFVRAVRVGTGCTALNARGMSYCASLEYMTIPNTVTTIGNYVWQNCYALKHITIPSSVSAIGERALQNCYGLLSVSIPNTITSISQYLLSNCYSLNSVTIPYGVTTIASNAVNSCLALTSVSLPSGLTTISDSAFGACYALAEVTIPSTVTSITTKAFQNCYGLGAIHFKPSSPPSIGASDTFSSLPTDCTIYVPTGKRTAYTSASNYPSSSTYTYVEE